ncbi:MAG TPA: bifunctional phosphoribosylaminoimidazolecarboxamide formyltransferase/IMP cyclohydrolase, partial [Rudaea sp.]|nr:bifunctional phosphoribosylaminoimidazolecarboxamide formyltransferase/IMP cyclohydrolase [Rudaea sp.]
MFDTTLVPIRCALLSVSDKTGIVDLARGLDALDINLISTGGTARALRDAGLDVRDVSDITGFAEIMDGRVKTLHPKIHGALLGRHGTDDAVMAQHQIESIDLLVVNLYPFERATAALDCPMAEAIEHIDIGGPAMLRAAAKNHERVTAVVDPADYAQLLEVLRSDNGTTLELRRKLAAKVYAHTARYDGVIANWLGARMRQDRVE